VVHQTTEAVQQVVVEAVEDVAAAVPDVAPVVASILPEAQSASTSTPTSAPAEVVEVAAIVQVATAPVTLSGATPTITVQVPDAAAAADDSTAEPSMPTDTDVPSDVDDQPEAVLPVDEGIVAIHDREPIRVTVAAVTTPASPIDVEAWAPLIAVAPPAPLDDLVSAPVAETAPPSTDLATSLTQTHSVRNSTSAPTTEPGAPTRPQTALPVSHGLSWGGGPDWVASLPAAFVQDAWTRLFTIGRELPSVIVLPNLAPPG
jgi:hypothetical protein